LHENKLFLGQQNWQLKLHFFSDKVLNLF